MYGSIVLRIGDVCVKLRHFNANILMVKLILHNRTYLFHVFQIYQPKTQAAFVFLVSKVLFRSSICFNFSSVWMSGLDCSITSRFSWNEPALLYSLRPQGSLFSKRFGVVSERRKTNERQGTGNKSSLPPSSFTRPIFRAVFDSRNLFFAPKPYGNEPQGTKPHPLERRPIDDRIDRSPDGAHTPWHFFIEWVPFLF